MNYRTILADATNWLFSDIHNFAYVIGAFFVVIALNVIRKELSGKK